MTRHRSLRQALPLSVLAASALTSTAVAQAGIYLDESAVLHATNGEAGDRFGAALDLFEDTLVVGAIGDDDRGLDAGAAYVFERTGTTWTETDKLFPSDPAPGDEFGNAVSIHGDTIVVGAFKNSVATALQDGAAYVFVRQGTEWVQQARLLAGDPGPNYNFGYSVSNWGDKVLVGSPDDDVNGNRSGSAYLFVRNGAVWTQLEKLTPSDAVTRQRFGFSVSIFGPRLVVGAPNIDGIAIDDYGAAYVFVREGTNWVESQKLMQTFGDDHIAYGRSVAINQDVLAVGAPYHYNGIGWVYRRDASDDWVYDSFALPIALGQCCARYAWSLDVDGDFLIGGGWNEWPGATGMAYLHERHGNWWGQKAWLRASDGAYDDELGVSVAIHGDTTAAGAWGADHLGDESGAVYLHSMAPIEISESFCFGDGSDNPCPCGNETPPGNGDGCGNTVTGNGAALYVTGTNSVAANYLNFFCHSDAMTSALLFIGSNDPGGGTPFGGGLLCLGGQFTRLPVASGGGGLAQWYWHQGLQSIGGWGAGDTVLFQVWYRVPPGMNPCGAEFSLSNALRITFEP